MSELAAYIDQIRRDTQNSPRARGAAFENLVQFYLKNDALQQRRYSRVQTYTEWANEQGEYGQDIGIDLVAELADGKGFVAIQCKCYAADKVIQKGDLDKFISASSREAFQHRVFVDTTEKDWGANVQTLIPNLNPKLTRLTPDQMEKSDIEWGRFIDKGEIARKEMKKLRPHQRQALKKVLQGFETHDRGKLIMACGTGKTLTSLRIAEKFATTPPVKILRIPLPG